MEKPDFGKPKDEGDKKDFVLNPDGSLTEAGAMDEQEWEARREG